MTNFSKTYLTLFLTLIACSCVVAQDGSDVQTEFDGDDLLKAAQDQDVSKVKAILDSGVDVNSQSKYGSTPLYFAADRGNVELARLLLEAGADPNLKDRFYNGTPMWFAQWRKHYDVIQCLIEYGAENPEAVLFSAISTNDLDLAQAVLKSGKVVGQELAQAKLIANGKGEKWTELFADLEIPEIKEYKPSTEDLKRLTGKYESSGFSSNVTLEGENLMLGFGSASGTSLKPLQKGKFMMGQSLVYFSEDDGAAQSVTINMAGNSFTLDRAKNEPKNDDVAPPSDVSEAEEFSSDRSQSLAEDKSVSSSNWPMFRGNGSRGIAEGQKPPVQWNVAEDQNVKWKIDVEGLGLSCPSIWGDQLFITSAVSDDDSGDFRTGLYGDVDSVEDDSEYDFNVYCIDKNDGSLIWKKTAHHSKPAVKRHAKSSHANSTIAVSENCIVAFFASEGLYCYSHTGDLIWKKDLGFLDSGWFYDADYQWGFASSPVIYKDDVVVQCDIQDQSFIASYSLEDGSENWKVERDEIPSWSSPIVHQFDDLPMLIVYGTSGAQGFDVRDGQLLWELKGQHSEIVVPTPFVAHGLIYVCSGYQPTRPIYAIRSTARGDVTLKEGQESSDHVAWMKPRGGPYLPTPVVYGDYLYVCDNSGILTCYQATTGKKVYRKRMSAPGGSLSFSASILAADGHIYFSSEDGRVLVVKAGPKYELVATNVTGENVLATPAISDGVFYLRTQNSLIAIEDSTETE